MAQNAIVAGESTTVEGSVVKDLYAFTEILALSGKVGEDLEVFGNRVTLLDQAHVAGDARLHIPSEENFHRASGAQVDGEVEFLDMPEELKSPNRYASVQFYLWQIARLVSALLVGLALLWLVPGFREISVKGGIEGLKTAGIGLVTLVSVPTIAVLFAITLVGLPFSVMALCAWILCIYLAKIVVGVFVGRLMLSGTKYLENDTLVLLAGIGVIIVAINLPYIGGFLSFVLTLVGIGLIIRFTSSAQARRT